MRLLVAAELVEQVAANTGQQVIAPERRLAQQTLHDRQRRFGASQSYGIAVGPDLALWFTELAGNKIGRLGLPTFTLSVSASSPAGGTVTGGGAGPFMALSSRTVTATANPGYAFVNWTQAGRVVSTSPSYTFTLAGNFALVANFARPGAHDFNGDTKSDIAWLDTSGNVAIWLMNGTTILNANTSFVAANVGSQWAIVGQRDFNGDGYADLLWHDTSGNVAIWMMNGTTVSVNNPSVANVPTNWSILGSGDFNGDGLATSCGRTPRVTWQSG
jgi:hypothetical protein